MLHMHLSLSIDHETSSSLKETKVPQNCCLRNYTASQFYKKKKKKKVLYLYDYSNNQARESGTASISNVLFMEYPTLVAKAALSIQ